jgi:hypothetical protein
MTTTIQFTCSEPNSPEAKIEYDPVNGLQTIPEMLACIIAAVCITLIEAGTSFPLEYAKQAGFANQPYTEVQRKYDEYAKDWRVVLAEMSAGFIILADTDIRDRTADQKAAAQVALGLFRTYFEDLYLIK